MTPTAEPLDDEVAGKAFDARLARRLARYVRPHGALVAAALGLLTVEGLLQLAQPLLTRHVIDVAVPAGDLRALGRDAVLFIGVLVTQFFSEYAGVLCTTLLGQRVMHGLRRDLFDHLQHLSIPFFDRSPVGRLVTRVTSDVEALNELFTSGVVAGIGDLFTLLAIAVFMFTVDWRLTLAAFGVVPFIYLASHVFRIRVRDSYRDIRTRIARINAFLQERLTGMRIVQLFGREQSEGARFAALNRSHLDAHLRSVTVYALETDQIDSLTEWRSVVVKGALYLLEADGPQGDVYTTALDQLRTLSPHVLDADDPTPERTLLFRIHADQVTGRASGV